MRPPTPYNRAAPRHWRKPLKSPPFAKGGLGGLPSRCHHETPPPPPSFRRRPESRTPVGVGVSIGRVWIPVFAGMTAGMGSFNTGLVAKQRRGARPGAPTPHHESRPSPRNLINRPINIPPFAKGGGNYPHAAITKRRPSAVIPAQAGIQNPGRSGRVDRPGVDSRFRGNDGGDGRRDTALVAEQRRGARPGAPTPHHESRPSPRNLINRPINIPPFAKGGGNYPHAAITKRRPSAVIPAQAGIQNPGRSGRVDRPGVDSRFRGNDGGDGRRDTALVAEQRRGARPGAPTPHHESRGPHHET